MFKCSKIYEMRKRVRRKAAQLSMTAVRALLQTTTSLFEGGHAVRRQWLRDEVGGWSSGLEELLQAELARRLKEARDKQGS